MKKYLIDFPDLVSQWHPEKNGDLKLETITHGTGKKVWWKCPKGDDHEWLMAINNRTGKRKTGCPFCSSKRVSKSNSFVINFPAIAEEFHPSKNQELQPEKLTQRSSKKVWWKCPKGDDHEWMASIKDRTTGHKCPFCSGAKVSLDNNLAIRFPNIAKEWHQARNVRLKPSDVTSGSGRKVWWRCLIARNHEWQARIEDRVNGSGCPF